MSELYPTGQSVRLPPATGEMIGYMHSVELVIAVGWAAFWIYWIVAAFSMKRGRVQWSRELRIRAVVVILAILLLRTGPSDPATKIRIHGAPALDSCSSRSAGFAIWARLHIGRNWARRCRKRTSQNSSPAAPTVWSVIPSTRAFSSQLLHRDSAELVLAYCHGSRRYLLRLQRNH